MKKHFLIGLFAAFFAVFQTHATAVTITNGDFSGTVTSNIPAGWSISGTAGTAGTNYKISTGAKGTSFILGSQNHYQLYPNTTSRSYKFLQTKTGLAAGYYTVSAKVILGSGGSFAGTCYLYANTTKTQVTSYSGLTYTATAYLATSGSLEFGIELVSATGVVDFDDFAVDYSPITTSISSNTFTTFESSKSFTVTGAGLTAALNITTPSGITLSGTNVTGTAPNYSIALANANATNTITATWDGSTAVSAQNIAFASNSVTYKNITVSSDNSAQFAPTSNQSYYLIQGPSASADANKVIGSSSGSPALVSALNINTQQFIFEAGPSTNQYYIKNGDGNYLNFTSGTSVAYGTQNGDYSIWSIKGTTASGIRLINKQAYSYLNSATVTSGSALVVGGANDATNGSYTMVLSSTLNQNCVIDGGFENATADGGAPIGDWVSSPLKQLGSGTVSRIRTGATYVSTGTYSFMLRFISDANSYTSISNTISGLTPNHPYTLNFKYKTAQSGGDANVPDAGSVVNVYASNTQNGDLTTAVGGSTNFVSTTSPSIALTAQTAYDAPVLTFTPSQSSCYLVFAKNNNSIYFNTYIDNVTLTDVSPIITTLNNITVDVNPATWSTSFVSGTTTYTINLPAGTTTVTPTVTKAFSGETVTGDGQVTLVDGAGTSTIVVTSQDGNHTTTYTLNYTTKSIDATLSNLTVSSGLLKPAFSSDVTTYTVYLPNGTTSATPTATKNFTGASVSGDGAISLTNGAATSTIVVTAEDGITQKTYTITWSGLARKHHYTFDTDASDINENGANAVNGTLYNNTTNASISGGVYSTTGTGTPAVASLASGDFIALSGSSLGLSTYPAVTIEFNIQTSNGLNGTSFTDLCYFGDGGAANSFYVNLTRGDGLVSRTSYQNTKNADGFKLDDGAKHHIVSILTKDSVYMYIDGYLAAKVLNSAGTVNIGSTYAYLGKSGWTDPTWKGTIDEFNIYTGRMDATTVASNASTYLSATPMTYSNAAENTITANKSAYSVIAQPGSKLTISSGQTLKAGSTLTLQSDATNGTATILNSGTLSVPVVNVQQYLTSGRNWYISSPVSNAAVSSLNTATSVLRYDEPSAQFVAVNSGNLTPALGYISSATTGTGTVTFSGTLNDGSITINPTRTYNAPAKAGFNLIGNPYASYLNWDQVSLSSNVSTTMWYRTKNSGNTAYVFDTYNKTGQLGTNNNGQAVTADIPPMQAFWVRVAAPVLAHDTTGTVTFNNTMRAHRGATDLLMRAPAVHNSLQQVLRLQVSNGLNTDETIVLFNPNASNTLDDYDSYKMTNNNVALPEIYTTVGSDNLVINGLNSVDSTPELPLGFTTGQANAFSIRASQVSNFDGYSIYLRDKVLNTETDLTNGTEYNFSSDVTSTASRFAVVFRSTSVSTALGKSTLKNVHVEGKEKQIAISSSESFGVSDRVTVYSITGQQLINEQLTHSSMIVNSSFNPGIYMVTLDVNGQKRTDKVIVK